ncbi:MAG TPA: HAMP domain-containing sensor histidine kinase [Gemmatimonas sp.]|nr:HAMP domain-containing sensor histidine kinase [Gemmatimonas sp.]
MTDESADAQGRDRQALALFARRLTHDLNNFATIIQTYTELVLPEITNPTARSDLGEVHAAAGDMVGYLRRVVRFSRTGSMVLLPVNVTGVVSEVVAALQENSDGSPLQLKGECTLPVHADALWLRDIARELIQNACEASPRDRTVVIELVQHGGVVAEDATGARWAVLRVVDEGPGFADAVAHNAEDPFVTTKDGVRGAGFGLTLAAAFAARVGGRLERYREQDRTHVELWMPAEHNGG